MSITSDDSRDREEAFWQQVYEARQAHYEAQFGPLPNDILKMMNLVGVWPGGGLYAIPATLLGDSLRVYTTFGLTNPDMPATITVSNSVTQTDAQGRPIGTQGTLQRKESVLPTVPGQPGYGYELMIVTRDEGDWPLWLLQWAVNAELLNDVGILERVKQYQGLTVEQIGIGGGNAVNIFIAPAQPPLPTGFSLPNGEMTLLVMTTITDDEMQWALEQGRPALLQRLLQSGIGQVSTLNRRSMLA
ncbi:MAG: suppressor of fused domain protein [Cytophagales bacterium]|nr:suppressor of fused domain protein [Armatimonadota bacterium]